jgi:hypothetical protein
MTENSAIPGGTMPGLVANAFGLGGHGNTVPFDRKARRHKDSE